MNWEEAKYNCVKGLDDIPDLSPTIGNRAIDTLEIMTDCFLNSRKQKGRHSALIQDSKMLWAWETV